MLKVFLFLCGFLIIINQGRIALFLVNHSKKKIIDEETVVHSVWKIQDKSKAVKMKGTGFFIGPTKIITNFHVIQTLSSLEDIRITQEETSRELRVKKLVSVSIEEDLALLETEESVSDYLNLEEEELDSPESLYVVAYPGGKFKKINQTGILKWNFFSSDNLYNSGASGGPVLDKNHNLVGVVSMAHYNLLFFIEIEDLKNFLEDKDFLCRELNFKGCMKRVGEDYLRYLQGEKVPQDYYKIGVAFQRYEKLEFVQEQVKKWFEISVNQGHVLAQLELAKMHYKGLGTWQDFTKARELLERLANQGHSLAQYKLAGIYYKGIGTEKDLEKSREWFEESAKQGHVVAQYKLARIYYKGLGTEKDLEKSREWFEKSAKQGHIPAQLKLAEMHSKGLGTKQDFTKAREWFEEVVNQLNMN
ncbi:MAG: bifunctional trypsin-like peptidase domain-containing/SEL1-like repeat protein [Bdellovibrionales bacterium]|nr:bifunctional trypsin-like peptidase domain-containing/SEL1-like repeat protein [Bdellovibrionales bacterium]